MAVVKDLPQSIHLKIITIEAISLRSQKKNEKIAPEK